MAVTVTGKFTAQAPTDFTGYRAMVFFQDDAGNHRALESSSDRDGNFTIEVLPTIPANAEVQFQAQAPGGIIVGERNVRGDALNQSISIQVVQAIPTTVRQVNVELGKRMRVVGRILNEEGAGILAGVPVQLLGKVREAGAFRVLAVTTTRNEGYFGVDVIAERLVRAGVKVGPLDPHPLPPENEHFPRHVIAVIEEPVSPVVTASDATPRNPDQEDFEANPGVFNEDRGGQCVNFTTPNRTLEEVPFFAVVRTTQPNIKGFVVGPDSKVADPGLVSGLKNALGRLQDFQVKTRAIAGGSSAPAPAPLPVNPSENRFVIGRGPVGSFDLAVEKNISQEFTTLTAPGLTNIKILSKAVGAFHDFQKPDDLAPAVQDVANAGIRDLIKAATASGPGRTELDQSSRIDWDDTPTIYQATEIAHGHLLTFKQVWKADGYSLGDLLYSLPLAPGQKKLVSTFDWNRDEVAARVAERREVESFSAGLVRDRDISETISTALHESLRARSEATTKAVGGGIGAFIGPIIIGGGGGFSRSASSASQLSTRSVSGLSLQQIQDRTTQASSLVRSQRATVVQTARQGESLRAQTEVVANYNHCHAMTVEYFEVLRHFKVTTELTHVQECLFVPFDISEFDGPKALRWKEELSRTLPARFRRYLPALERQQTNWARADFPLARYADETLKHFDGEVQLRFSLPRPDDNVDGSFNASNWAVYSVLFAGRNTEELWRAHIGTVTAARRDAAWNQRVAPILVRTLAELLRVELLDRNQTLIRDVPIDATVVTRFAQDVPVLISLRPRAGTAFTNTRADVGFIRVKFLNNVLGTLWSLPERAKVVVYSATLRYRTDHFNHAFVNGQAVSNDLSETDAAVIATPLDRHERRNPREEDVKSMKLLLAYLNEHLERTHRGVWLSFNDQHRFLLLDGFIAPNSGGRSVASVVENRLIGIVGNSLVFPVVPGLKLDPSYELEERATLTDLYAGETAPALRISIPTRGVFAEAILGKCTACEEKDDSRFWRWEESRLPDDPPKIEDLSLTSRRGTPAVPAVDEFPEAVVQLQTAPKAPEPTTLDAALRLIGTPNLFRDLTGVQLNTENAAKAFNTALDTAEFFGTQAASIAKQQYLNREMDRNLERIQRAREKGLITRDQERELTDNMFRAATGQPSSGATAPSANPAMQSVMQRAANSSTGRVSVRNPSGRVDISTGQQVGAGQSFDVTPAVPLIAQPGNLTCWAATGAMLLSWRDGPMSIEQAMGQVGAVWLEKFSRNEGLTLSEVSAFTRALGLAQENPASYLPRGILNLLRSHGPLWVIGDDSIADNRLSHVVIVTGITDADNADIARVKLADPNGGIPRNVSYADFAASMEASDPVALGFGIFHF